MKEIDTIREAQFGEWWSKISAAMGDEGAYKVSESNRLMAKAGYIAALSTIDPDAKQEPSKDTDMSEVDNHISYCWLKCATLEDGKIIFDREHLAECIAIRDSYLITAHDDAIRRECAERFRVACCPLKPLEETRKAYKAPDSCDICRKRLMDGYCSEVEAILGTEPARDIKPFSSDEVAVLLHAIDTEPAREESE